MSHRRLEIQLPEVWKTTHAEALALAAAAEDANCAAKAAEEAQMAAENRLVELKEGDSLAEGLPALQPLSGARPRGVGRAITRV
jgi:hypothetical protein